MAQLKDLGTIITGNTPKTSDQKNYNSLDIPFVKPSDISESEISHIYNSEFYISEYAREKARILPANSVLFTCIGIIGKTAINKVECAFNQQINAIIPDKNKCLTDYLVYALHSKKKQLQDTANAPVVPILNKTQFSEIEIPLPSLQEQKQIAINLNIISDLISLRKQQLSKLDELVKARFVEMLGTLQNNKNNYQIKSLQEVCEPIKDGTHQTPTYTDDIISGYKFLSSKDVTTGKIDWNHLKYIPEHLHKDLYVRIAPRKGDILLAKNGTTGVAAIVDRDEIFDIYVSLALLRPINMNSVYLWAAVNSYETKRQFDSSLKGIGVPNLHLGEIKKVKIVVPPIELQNEFADFVKQIDKSKFEIQQSLEKLEILKKSLMQQYFV